VKLKLTPKGANQTLLDVGECQVFFSYKTAVAAFVPGRGYLRTAESHSRTTTAHINKWIDGDSTEVPQAELDAMLTVTGVS
jgi:hypothetical protein